MAFITIGKRRDESVDVVVDGVNFMDSDGNVISPLMIELTVKEALKLIMGDYSEFFEKYTLKKNFRFKKRK